MIEESGCRQSDKFWQCDKIPKNLGTNITRLYLDFTNAPFSKFSIDFGQNWDDFKDLNLHNSRIIPLEDLRNLKSLEELTIGGDNLFLFMGSFSVLEKLKSLSIYGRFNNENLANALKYTSPDLERLYLKNGDLVRYDHLNARYLRSPSAFVTALAGNQLKSFKLYNVTMEEIDFILLQVVLTQYVFVNMSFSKVYKPALSTLSPYHYSFQDRLNAILKTTVRKAKYYVLDHNNMYSVFDASYMYSALIEDYIENIVASDNSYYELLLIPAFYTANILNFTSITHSRGQIELKNITVGIVNYLNRNFTMRELILQNNRLKYLDVTFPCYSSDLERLDLSSNIIEYIHPKLCQCCSKLREINLSNNRLTTMADRNDTSFKQLFLLYENLKNIFLSQNQLSKIPMEFFKTNNYLEQIDLSDNILTSISFDLKHLTNLKTLNLQRNRFSVLDTGTLTKLQQLSRPLNKTGVLKMAYNSLMCSECNTLSSIHWLATTALIDPSGRKLVCKSTEDRFVPLNQTTVKQLKEICKRPMLIKTIVLLSTIIPLGTCTFMALFAYTVVQYRRFKLRMKHIEDKIELIQLNQLDTKYVIFLSYCSKDSDFVDKYIYKPLKEHLQEKLNTERDIICVGDKNFQLGKPVNDEMVRSLRNSAVVLLVLSHNFCNSEFCRMEFDHALFMKKPFILMVKEIIEINEMVPSLQEIFKRNTRLLWEREGDIYQMKTSWDNVCHSVLELIP